MHEKGVAAAVSQPLVDEGRVLKSGAGRSSGAEMARYTAMLSELGRDANEVGQVLLLVEESNHERALGRTVSRTSESSPFLVEILHGSRLF